MVKVDVNIQEGWMIRKGWRGRYLTAYRHDYNGTDEKSGREHNHPWALTISIILRGGYSELVNGVLKHRTRFTVHCYRNADHHKIVSVKPGTRSLFLGLCRVQTIGRCYSELTPYGAAHYSELRSVASADVTA